MKIKNQSYSRQRKINKELKRFTDKLQSKDKRILGDFTDYKEKKVNTHILEKINP